MKLAKISNQYALTLIKSGKYELAETTLLKNKQIIEPLADKSSWENKLDWQIMRITIISNLLIIFQKLQKPLKLYQILKNFFPNLRLDILFNYPQCFERDIDPIFISMTLCCFNFKRYEEAEMYANDGIKLIRKILRNDFLLFSIQAHFQKNKLNWDNFLNKKNYSLGKLLNILGKISEKLQKKDEAINHYSQAYNLMKMFFGEDSKLTLSFKQDLSRLRELSPLLIKLKSEYNLNNNCDMSLNDQKDNTQTEVFTKKNNSNKSIFSPKYNITNNNDENIISIKKNISFARLANNEMTNSRKRKCFTIHETCKNIVSEHTKLVIKNKKSRPFSANTKLKSKEFLSDYLLTRKESMGKFPDIFKIKIFYPDNASKKIGKRDRIVNESVTADFQSTKLINSIQFDKSSLKSVLNAHRKNQKSNNETTTQFVLDLNDSQTNQTSKYSLILAKRPTSSSRFPKGITRQTSTIEKRLSNHFSLKNSGKSEEESNITNSKFEHKIEGSENQSMSQIKMFDIPNFETEIKNTSPFNSPKMKIPKRISETVNSSSSKIKMNSKRFSNIIGDESQNYNLRGNFIKTDFKLAPEENTPKSSFFDKNIFSNKRTHIDVGQFTKQKIEFLRPSTPQQNKNMFSLKSEKKILSQTQLFSYMQHQEKIIVIQRFLKLCLKKLKKIIPLSSIEKPKEKESSITLSRNLNSNFNLFIFKI